MGPDGVGVHGDGEVARPDPPPVEIRYPAAVRVAWRQIAIATVGGAAFGFGLIGVVLDPASVFGYIGLASGGGVAMMNLITGPKLAAKFAFQAGRFDASYRLAESWYRMRVSGEEQVEVPLGWDDEPTYPDE